MMILLTVVLAVSGALLIGALWGIYGRLPGWCAGFTISLAGSALIISLMRELIEPATHDTSLTWVILSIVTGAIVFTAVDYMVDEKWENSSGSGLLVAITLDGVPENLALGVALIGADPGEVMALAGAIFLSNLPESAVGAKLMLEDGNSRSKILGLWGATVALLSVAAILGNFGLREAPDDVLAVIRCFAAGAVVASLTTEMFPKAYQENQHFSGIATVLGVVLTLLLDVLYGA